MFIDVKTIKQKQDEIESRKKKLLENFIPFRESLLDYLENFTAEAINQGVKNVSPLEKSKTTAELVSVSVTINSLSLSILSTNEALFPNPKTDKLAARLFLYFDNTQRANVVVTFQEADEAKNVYYAEWATEEGLELLSGKSIVTDPASSGKEAADKLINLFYSFIFFWSEKPSFSDFMKERLSKQNFGYVK